MICTRKRRGCMVEESRKEENMNTWTAVLGISIMVAGFGAGYILGVLHRRNDEQGKDKNNS